MHAGNARSDTAKVTKAFCSDNFLRIAPHPDPPYSPDLAPFDFFLFEHLKNRLQRQQFGPTYEFLSGVRKIRDEISDDRLEAVFRKWIKRLNRCIAALQQMESTWNEVNNGPLSDS
jgi:hypothetical protein